MKTRMIFILCVLFLSCNQNMQELDGPNDTLSFFKDCQQGGLAWDYPVKPGMERWKQLQSHQEMVHICQIPKNILSSLTTEELTDICLQYPLLLEIFAFNTYNDGLDRLFENFNGIRELFKRKEVLKELLSRYICKIQHLPSLDSEASDVEKGGFAISVSLLECILSRYQSQDASMEDYKAVLQCLVDGYEGKLKYEDYFHGSAISANLFSRAHIIVRISPQSLDIIPLEERRSILLGNGGVFAEETVGIIDDLSYRLIK